MFLIVCAMYSPYLTPLMSPLRQLWKRSALDIFSACKVQWTWKYIRGFSEFVYIVLRMLFAATDRVKLLLRL